MGKPFRNLPAHQVNSVTGLRKRWARVTEPGEHKHCKECRRRKELNEFASYLVQGKRYWHTRCNHCRAEQYKHSDQCREKKELILSLRSGACLDCGEQHPFWRNHFVPVCGCPAFKIETAWTGRSKDAIKREAKKYGVVCSNCRADREYKRYPERMLRTSLLAQLPPDLQELTGHPVDASVKHSDIISSRVT